MEFPTQYPRPGWAEQDPERWYTAFRTGVAALLERLGADPARHHRPRRGLGDPHLGADGRPLRGPAAGHLLDGPAQRRAVRRAEPRARRSGCSRSPITTPIPSGRSRSSSGSARTSPTSGSEHPAHPLRQGLPAPAADRRVRHGHDRRDGHVVLRSRADAVVRGAVRTARLPRSRCSRRSWSRRTSSAGSPRRPRATPGSRRTPGSWPARRTRRASSSRRVRSRRGRPR